jgi:hypothetical protein
LPDVPPSTWYFSPGEDTFMRLSPGDSAAVMTALAQHASFGFPPGPADDSLRTGPRR